MATMHVIGISCHDLIFFGKDPEVNDGFNGGGTNTLFLFQDLRVTTIL
jgi:hypothetical protein